MMQVAPVVGRGVISFGLLVGQAEARSRIMTESITGALMSYRMVTFPTDPQFPWKVSSIFFKRLVDTAISFATEQGAALTTEEVAEAFVLRGYTVSDLNPFTMQPITVDVEPLIAIPQFISRPDVEIPYTPAPIRRVTVTIPRSPSILRLPEPLVLPIQADQVEVLPAEPAGSSKWLIVAGLAAVLLSRAA